MLVGAPMAEPIGSAHGSGHGLSLGAENDATDGLDHGDQHVVSHGGSPGVQYGLEAGFTHGTRNGTALECQLGFRLHVVNGVVTVLAPGEQPPPNVSQHIQAFLAWLQTHEEIAGNEVPAQLLASELYPLFCDQPSHHGLAWKTVAQHLAKLPGIEKRQIDGRNAERDGPSVTVYRIPKRKAK
jgi:hypothetical protein